MTTRAEHPELPDSAQNAGQRSTRRRGSAEVTVAADTSLSFGPQDVDDSVGAQVDAADATGASESTKAIGVYINSVEAQVIVRRGDDIEGVALNDESNATDPIPPAVLIPRFSGEPLHADLHWPPRPRGTGEHWPPEARVESRKMPGRFPVGYAWHMASTGMPWVWNFEDNASAVHAPDAIAQVIATLTDHKCDRRNSRGEVPSPTCLVIPNHLDERAQQSLIDTMKMRRMRVSMLPRPIAAAMTWCNRFNLALREDRKHDSLKVDEPVGSVVTLHLGLDHWEAAFVDIVARRDRKEVVYLPARRRRCIQPLSSYGLELMHRLAIRSLEMSYQQMKADRVWELIWCTPWMKTALAMLSGEKSASFPKIIQLAKHARKAEFLVQQCRQATQRIFRHGENVPALLRQCQGKSPQFTDIRDWFTAVGKQAKNEQLLGAVVTGPMTMIPQERDTVANHYLRKLWPQPSRVLIGGMETDTENVTGLSRDVLAHAAAAHAQWIAQREENSRANTLPTYLESIPRVRIGANAHGKPAWLDLFENFGQYVPGGVTIQRPYPLAGLPIKPHTDAFKIAIHHEDLPTVHLASAPLPQPVEQPEPVNLHVSFQPGQGFPTIQLVPQHEGLFGRHRIFVDFRSLTDTGKTADEFLALMQDKSKGKPKK